MNDSITVIMPMAGRGSRFSLKGLMKPKPLIEIKKKPFFYWASLGILREIPQAKFIYLVLRAHVESFNIDLEIKKHFPYCKILIVDEVTAGALNTSILAAPYVDQGSLVIINDCDHAFVYSKLSKACESLRNGFDGFLTHFYSEDSHFSYAKYSDVGLLIKTAEKEIISRNAIAGVYGFSSIKILTKASKNYFENCRYSEFYISGVYNELVKLNYKIKGYMTDSHLSFGTPQEYINALKNDSIFNILDR